MFYRSGFNARAIRDFISQAVGVEVKMICAMCQDSLCFDNVKSIDGEAVVAAHQEGPP